MNELCRVDLHVESLRISTARDYAMKQGAETMSKEDRDELKDKLRQWRKVADARIEAI